MTPEILSSITQQAAFAIGSVAVRQSCQSSPVPEHLGGWSALLEWRDVPRQIAQVAQRAGFSVRPKPGWNSWQVWATEQDIPALQAQLE